jgi:hypothetical protein
MDSALTTVEQHSLNTYERTIERGINTFYEVGTALAAIRDKQLYRVEFKTFEAYCQERWGWNRNRAYELINAAETTDCIQLNTKPANEAQARPLSKLPKEHRAEAWESAVETAPKNEKGEPVITAKHVEATVAEFIEPADLPSPKKQPARESKSSPRKKQGDSLVTAASRKAVLAALSALERALEQIGYLARCEGQLEQIRSLLDA